MTIRKSLVVGTAAVTLLAIASASGVVYAAPAEISPAATITLTGYPIMGVLAIDADRMYVSVWKYDADGSPTTGEVAVIDTWTNTVLSRIPVGVSPVNVSINPAGTRV